MSLMSTLPKCPQCGSEYTYVDGNMYVCPECAHEWSADAPAEAAWDLLMDVPRIVPCMPGAALDEVVDDRGDHQRCS